MYPILWATIAFLVLLPECFARLADTQDQAEARYGLPKKPIPSFIRQPLVEGAKELTFEFQGYRIRCALLLASDGREYVVREEYAKIWNGEVMKAGGVIQIRDFERDAILAGEAGKGTWTKRVVGDLGRNPIEAFGNQIAHLSGLSGTVWVREDGAIARMQYGGGNITLDLPQARKYEAEMKAIKEQKARAAVPKF